MSAVKLYGHDGRPLLISTSNADRPLLDVGKIDVPAMEEELRKRVRDRAGDHPMGARARGTSLMAGVLDRERGKDKPTPVTFATLRLMAQRNEWVRAIIRLRKAQLGRVKCDIVLKDTDDTSGAAEREAQRLRRLLSHPEMRGSKPTSKSWRSWLGMFLGDLLELDACAVEKERNGRREIVALYNVDGATIRPNIDEEGGYHDDAYVQVVDGQVTARFGMEELLYGMDNPQTDVRFAGYGLSPLESLIISVTADLHAAKYNASYFEKGSVPEGILDLGEDVAPEDVDAFRLYWMSEVLGRPWSLPIIGGSKAPQFLQWRAPNRDMQFMEYQNWLLQKMCAVYQVSPKDLGQIDDVNRSTAEDASQQSDEGGVEPLQSLIKDYIDTEIIGPHGEGLGDYLEFEWAQQGESAEAINSKFQPMHDAGVATGMEWRDAHGDLGEPEEGTPGAEGLNMHLTSGDRKPLPSSEDTELMGEKAQQEREDQQAEDTRQHDVDQAKAAAKPPVAKTTPAAPEVEKVAPDGHDRNPALTDRQADAHDEFELAATRLVEGLAQVLAG